MLSSKATLGDYKERPNFSRQIVANKTRKTPTKSITIKCIVARKRKEKVGKEMELIAQQD